MKLNQLMKLSKRENYAIALAVVFTIFFIIIRFAVFPIIDKRGIARRNLQLKKEVLKDMGVLYTEYLTIKKRSQHIEKRLTGRSRNFTLFSFLDRLAGKTKIKSRIVYMKPTISVQRDGPYRISSVEMKLESVSTKAFISYIHKIESSDKIINIKRISVVKNKKKNGLLNVVLLVETFEI